MAGLDINWSTSQGKDKITLRAFNQIRSMLQERATGCNYTLPSSIQNDLPENKRVRKSHRQAVDSAFNAILERYFNQYDHSGDWEGVEISNLNIPYTALPRWTLANLLTQIGDGSRLPLPNDHINCADWNWQTVRLLNELKWADGTDFTYDYADWENRDTELPTPGHTFLENQTNFNAKAWVNGAGLSTGFRTNYALIFESGSTRFRIWAKRAKNQLTLTAGAGAIAHEIDFYYVMNIYDNGSTADKTRILSYFSLPLTGYDVSAPWKLLKLSKAISTDVDNKSDYLLNGQANVQSDFASDPSALGVNFFINEMVIKYDVTGGFEYIL